MDSVLLIATIAKIAFALIIVLTFSPVFVWAERRQSALIQNRIDHIALFTGVVVLLSEES